MYIVHKLKGNKMSHRLNFSSGTKYLQSVFREKKNTVKDWETDQEITPKKLPSNYSINPDHPQVFPK